MKYPALYIAIPFCIGIALSQFFNIPILPAIILSSVFIALTLLSISKVPLRAPCLYKDIFSHLALYLAVFFCGAAYYQNFEILPNNHISRLSLEEGRKASIKGVIVDAFLPSSNDNLEM